MGTRRPTLREIAEHLGLADHKSVRRHRDNGMPVHSLDAAAEWFVRNIGGRAPRDRLLDAGIAFVENVQPVIAELPLDAEQHDRVLLGIVEAWHVAAGMKGLGWANEIFDAVGLAETRNRLIDADNRD